MTDNEPNASGLRLMDGNRLPEEVLAHLSKLPCLSVEVKAEFLWPLVQVSMEGDDEDLEKAIEGAAGESRFSKSDMHSSVAAVNFLVSNAGSRDLSEEQFASDLSVVPDLSNEDRELLSSGYDAFRVKLRESFQRSAIFTHPNLVRGIGYRVVNIEATEKARHLNVPMAYILFRCQDQGHSTELALPLEGVQAIRDMCNTILEWCAPTRFCQPTKGSE